MARHAEDVHGGRSVSLRPSDRVSGPIFQRKKLGNVRGGKWSDPHATMDAVRGPDGFVLTIVHSQAHHLRRDDAGVHGSIACAGPSARPASASPDHDGAAGFAFAGSIRGRAGAVGQPARMDARTVLRAAHSPLRCDGDITAVAVSRMSPARPAGPFNMPERRCRAVRCAR